MLAAILAKMTDCDINRSAETDARLLSDYARIKVIYYVATAQ